jgi:iron complex outermembrane receptor protein
VANVDENSFRTSLSLLKVQTSHDLELGASWGDALRKLTARVFRHKLDNEIFYDPTAFANTNLDPTRRKGSKSMPRPSWRPAGAPPPTCST